MRREKLPDIIGILGGVSGSRLPSATIVCRDVSMKLNHHLKEAAGVKMLRGRTAARAARNT